MTENNQGDKQMDFDKYIKPEGRGLPVFLLLDVSGSMAGQKIGTVNVALKEMIESFRNIENPKGVVELCLITFGNGRAEVIRPLSGIGSNDNYDLSAMGDTPMGKSFDQVTSLIEDYNVVSSRSYAPTIVLISDGNPTDYDVDGKTAQEIMKWDRIVKVHTSPRTSKAMRLAMGIGDDLNVNVLKAFIGNQDHPVIRARDNSTISKFFEWVTMSVSENPNKPVTADIDEMFDDDEVEF